MAYPECTGFSDSLKWPGNGMSMLSRRESSPYGRMCMLMRSAVCSRCLELGPVGRLVELLAFCKDRV